MLSGASAKVVSFQLLIYLPLPPPLVVSWLGGGTGLSPPPPSLVVVVFGGGVGLSSSANTRNLSYNSSKRTLRPLPSVMSIFSGISGLLHISISALCFYFDLTICFELASHSLGSSLCHFLAVPVFGT